MRDLGAVLYIVDLDQAVTPSKLNGRSDQFASAMDTTRKVTSFNSASRSNKYRLSPPECGRDRAIQGDENRAFEPCRLPINDYEEGHDCGHDESGDQHR